MKNNNTQNKENKGGYDNSITLVPFLDLNKMCEKDLLA